VSRVIPVSVDALTSLGDDVFVVFCGSRTQVEVYDAVTVALKCRIRVRGLGNCLGLAACPINNCLYASDCENNSIHRVDLSGSGPNAVKTWSDVAQRPTGLSVNTELNVVVVSERESKLRIFTSHGIRLREIQLPENIRPHQAIQLHDGRFLVTHGDPCGQLNRVCLVDADGTLVVRSYGGPRGSDMTRMNCPRGLAVDRDGRVLVADKNNHRLLVFDQSLTTAREMTVDEYLRYPCELSYDQTHKRLCIGERDERTGRVIVIDDLENFSALRI